MTEDPSVGGERQHPEGPPHYQVVQRHPPREAVALVEAALGTPVRAVRKDTVGASHAIYFLTLEGGRDVVARLAIHPEHDLARDLWATDLCRRQGVPAPQALAARTDRSQGMPFAVLDRLPGRPAREARLTRPEREIVFEQLGAYLARIHAIRLDGYGELKPAESAGEERSHESRYVGTANSLAEFVVRGVERTVHELQNLQAQPQAQPHWPADALSPVRLSRLRERFDRERRLLDLPRAVLVHGDCRFKNVLLDGSRVTGIVDYELAAAGDPAMDLAWLGCEDVQTEAEWTAIWRGYGNTPDVRFERRLLLYKLWWSLRRLWWQLAWPDPEGIAADLANIAHVEAQLDR